MEPEVVSAFFCNDINQELQDLSDDFLNIVDELNESLAQIELPEAVKCVYNPTIYARHTFEMFVRRYCNTKKKIMYFGINPGPYGMSQTGVPFGEVNFVRNWMQIEGPVGKPEKELPTRPVKGFACTKSERSGKTFWGFFQKVCGTPEKFFESSFVYNYLPQQWMESNGSNITPEKPRVTETKELFNICDQAFIKTLKLYEVETVVAIGNFCEKRAFNAIKKHILDSSIQIRKLQHPSPRTVRSDDEWNQKAEDVLNKFNLMQYYRN